MVQSFDEEIAEHRSRGESWELSSSEFSSFSFAGEPAVVVDALDNLFCTFQGSFFIRRKQGDPIEPDRIPPSMRVGD